MSYNPSSSLLYQLLMAYEWVETSLQNALKQKGWDGVGSRAQSMVFLHVIGGITRPSEVAQALGISRQAVHQTIAELVSNGLLELVADPNDKRAKLIRFTEEGHTITMDAIGSLEHTEALLGQRIGMGNLTQLKKVLSADWGQAMSDQVSSESIG